MISGAILYAHVLFNVNSFVWVAAICLNFFNNKIFWSLNKFANLYDLCFGFFYYANDNGSETNFLYVLSIVGVHKKSPVWLVFFFKLASPSFPLVKFKFSEDRRFLRKETKRHWQKCWTKIVLTNRDID